MSVEDDIQEIKKEIIQSHNLIIKTDNLVSNLSGELRQIQKKQESYERKYWINSIWAYIIIATLCFVGVYVGFEAKVDAERRVKARLEEDLTKSQAEVEDLQKKLAVRAQQEKAAEHLLRLKRDNRLDEALKVAQDLDTNRLSPVLGRLVTRETEDLRQFIGQQSLEAGKTLFGRGYLKRSEREFDKVIGIKPPNEILADAHYQRANLMLKLNKNAKAAEDFLMAVDTDPKASFAANSLFMAAGSLETSGDVPRALEAYQRLLKEFPDSRYISQARRRIMRLKPKGDAPKPAKPADAAPAPETPAAAPAN
jgi:TolA-binding protein